MSSRHKAYKNSRHDSKRSSGSPSSPSSNQQNKSTGSRSSPYYMLQRQSSLSMHLTDSTAARASPRVSQPSNATPMPDSTLDTSQTFNTDKSYLLANARVDLLEMSAWTYPQQSPHHYQDFSYQSYNTAQTSTCPYHASEIGSGHNAAWYGYGLAPLERWLDKDVGDGGAVAVQFGHQLHVDCTCVATQDGGNMDAVNGTQHGTTSEN